METNKNLEYYLDSRIYSGEDVQKSIVETKKEFPNKKIKVTIGLNEYGMYIITFQFQNKNNFFAKIIIRIWRKFKKTRMLNKGENTTGRRYGQYKETKTYKPY
ncbi:MAG: hypothetical protein HFJ33_07715 [Clostridia bacterium]|nr:hypothetical protein [Clostridia bacterium]